MYYSQMLDRVLLTYISKKRYKGYICERYQPMFGAAVWRIKDRKGNILYNDIESLKYCKNFIDGMKK